MKTGFVVRNLAPSQLSYYLINSINGEMENSCTDEAVVFIQEPSIKMKANNFSMLNSTEMWSFSGSLISTDISTTRQLSSLFGISKKFFYVWDLLWCRPQWRNHELTIKAFTDPSIRLIARSEDHAKMIKNYCNRDVCGIVDDFNMEQLKEVIS
tara:strand:- start:104 stop:565 length:462 start_codon:yes stop_codon:yes gene_type:complete